MNITQISKKLPAKINGHLGELTIIKREKNGKYYCFYPTAIKEKVPVIKGHSIENVCVKMCKKLIEAGVITISKEKPISKKTITSLSNSVKKPLSKKERLKRKLRIQKNIVKLK